MTSSVQVVLSLLAGVFGLVLNGYILLVLLWNRKIRTVNSLLLLHMATLDIMHCLLLVIYTPMLGLQLGSGDVVDHVLCSGQGLLWSIFPTVLSWTVCGLSCDRYAAILQPLKYSTLMSRRRATCFLCCVWVLAVSIAVPPLIGLCHYRFIGDAWACIPSCSEDLFQIIYLALASCLSVVFPLSIVLSCNVHIFLIARYHRHRIASALYEVTLRAQATVTPHHHQRKTSACYLGKYRSGRNGLAVIARNVGTLFIVTVPYFAVLFWETVFGTRSHNVLMSIGSVLLCWGPSIHAYIYGIRSRYLRQTLKRILQRHVFKKQAHREVERRLSLISTRSFARCSLIRKSSYLGNNGGQPSKPDESAALRCKTIHEGDDIKSGDPSS